jgi:hypothetical protein
VASAGTCAQGFASPRLPANGTAWPEIHLIGLDQSQSAVEGLDGLLRIALSAPHVRRGTWRGWLLCGSRNRKSARAGRFWRDVPLYLKGKFPQLRWLLVPRDDRADLARAGQLLAVIAQGQDVDKPAVLPVDCYQAVVRDFPDARPAVAQGLSGLCDRHVVGRQLDKSNAFELSVPSVVERLSVVHS